MSEWLATLAHYQAALLADGYAEGRPPRFGLHDVPEMDLVLATQMACGRCRAAGLRYYPFFRSEPRSYVAIAACPRCGWATEL